MRVKDDKYQPTDDKPPTTLSERAQSHVTFLKFAAPVLFLEQVNVVHGLKYQSTRDKLVKSIQKPKPIVSRPLRPRWQLGRRGGLLTVFRVMSADDHVHL